MDFVTWLLICLVIAIVCLVPKLLSPDIRIDK